MSVLDVKAYGNPLLKSLVISNDSVLYASKEASLSSYRLKDDLPEKKKISKNSNNDSNILQIINFHLSLSANGDVLESRHYTSSIIFDFRKESTGRMLYLSTTFYRVSIGIGKRLRTFAKDEQIYYKRKIYLVTLHPSVIGFVMTSNFG